MEIVLGDKIRELREERGWSQNELAICSGLNRSYIAHMETNRINNPSGDTFIKLSRAFNIHPEELYQAAGYIKEARIPNRFDETPEQMLANIKLNVRRLEKNLKEQNNSGD